VEVEAAPHLFAFGFGYSARALAAALRPEGWRVSATTRSEEKRAAFARDGVRCLIFDRGRPLADAAAALADVTHLLVSAPPDDQGDPVLDQQADAIIAAPRLRWIGYLSTTGVYGDTGGARVDETAPLRPSSERSRRRVDAERGWLALHAEAGLPVHVFRLAGIYGPGRSAIDQVRRGEVRRIDRPGHLFSRIHVDDIACVLKASIARPRPGAIYNVCDDEPAAPADVTAYACRLLGVEPPPSIAFEHALPSMSAMARSFWNDNRRVDNSLLERELAVRLRYPDYRSGLAALAAARTGSRHADDRRETTNEAGG